MNRKKIDKLEKKKFEVSDEELELLKERNIKFLKRVNEAQVYKKGFDYSYKIPYEERCDDLKIFLINTFNVFEQYKDKYYKDGMERKFLNSTGEVVLGDLDSQKKEKIFSKTDLKKSEYDKKKDEKKDKQLEKFKDFKKKNFGELKAQNLDSINKKNLEKIRKLKKMIEKFEETQLHVQPLVELCETYRLNKEILKCLYHASHFAFSRDYVNATDHYMQVAIGNNPWPIGVTMVGVHERAGRSRIFTHVIKRKSVYICWFLDHLNDDRQKKYLIGYKRLLTFLQIECPPKDLKKIFLNK